MLRAKAIEYLKNLHGLEILAGLNFCAVRDELAARRLLSDELRDRLWLAFRQEMRHAVQVRRMLILLGHSDKRELTAIMHGFNDLLIATLSAFPDTQHGYARIFLNHAIEERLAKHGNQETFAAFCAVAGSMPTHAETEAMLHAARDFYLTVAREEPEHVALDAEVLQLYESLYVELDASRVMRTVRARGTSFHRAIRVKREFVKAAYAEAA